MTFIVGGADTGSGGLLHDTWAFAGATQTWAQLPLQGERPARVLAVTYRMQDNALYVIDTGAAPVPGITRLLRIDLASSVVTLLGAWHASHLVDSYYLSSMPDGHLFLLAAASSKDVYVAGTLRFRKHGVRIGRLTVGQGTPFTSPASTMVGVNVAIVHHHKIVNRLIPTAVILGPHAGEDESEDHDCGDVF
jgi:hypothetical protein